MPQIKTADYRPKLKAASRLPFAFSRQCQTCKKYSICVDQGAAFHLTCQNHFCRNKQRKLYVDCFLRFRNWEYSRMTLSLTKETTVELEEHGIEPDLDKMEDHLSLTDGPYQACKGVLTWDETQSGLSFLRCSVCTGIYDTVILSTYSSLALRDPVAHLHEYYISVRDLDNPRHVKFVRRESAPVPHRRLEILPVPGTSVMLVSRVRWGGEEIWDAEPQFVASPEVQ